MNKKYAVIILAGVVSIIIVSGMVISLQPQTQPILDFEWAVSDDESFLYDVRAFGEAPGGIISDVIQRQIRQMNGSTIIATIQSLPSLDNIIDASSFSREVIHFQKISCEFENGTFIPMHMETFLSEALSGCTLPIGGWGIITSFFPNVEYGYDPSTDYLSAILYDEYLCLQYIWYGDYDDNGGWWGDSSLVDGRALNALWQYGHQSQTIFIELTTVE